MHPRVLIAHDHAAVREGLRTSLESRGLDIVGEAGDGATALRLVAEIRPDVMLMDVSLADSNGFTLTRTITASYPATAVVILTMNSDPAKQRAAFSAGAVGYLDKHCTTANIVTLINDVVGERNRSEERSMSRFDRPALSARETEVLQLLADGISTKCVAQTLFISLKTTRNHLSNIYDKLDVTDRTQAILKAIRLGSIELRA